MTVTLSKLGSPRYFVVDHQISLQKIYPVYAPYDPVFKAIKVLGPDCFLNRKRMNR